MSQPEQSPRVCHSFLAAYSKSFTVDSNQEKESCHQPNN